MDALGQLGFIQEKASLNDQQLSKILDVNHMSVYHWKRGTRHPGPKSREKISQLHGIVENPPNETLKTLFKVGTVGLLAYFIAKDKK